MRYALATALQIFDFKIFYIVFEIVLYSLSAKSFFNFAITSSADTPTTKACWVLIYDHFQIYSKAYKTNDFL